MGNAVTGRPVILGMNASLDGYISGPAGQGDIEEIMQTMSDELAAHFVEALAEIDTMLMGRVNYLEQAEYWPTATDPMADVVNGHTKIVFASTLDKVNWQNARLATGTPAEEIAKLKTGTSGVIGVSGGARFAQSLLRDGLVDQVWLTVHPVALGGGTPLFTDLTRFELLSTKVFAKGVVLHKFAVTGRA
jgi:dihydrofolate reductase